MLVLVAVLQLLCVPGAFCEELWDATAGFPGEGPQRYLRVDEAADGRLSWPCASLVEAGPGATEARRLIKVDEAADGMLWCSGAAAAATCPAVAIPAAGPPTAGQALPGLHAALGAGHPPLQDIGAPAKVSHARAPAFL